MPRIEIWDPMGMVYSVMSSNPEVIRLWLIEQAERMTSTNSALTCQLRVHPLFSYPPEGGQAVPDWQPGAITSYEMKPEQFTALHDWLEDNHG